MVHVHSAYPSKQLRWNALPHPLKNMNLSYNSFKTQLKTHLFDSSAN